VLKVFKSIFILLLAISYLNSFKLKNNPVKEFKWKSGETLLGFLEKQELPLKLYYDLDGEDKKVIMQIREGTTCYIAKDCYGNIYQAIIPLNEELEVHISKSISDKYQLDIIPIKYSTKKIKKLISITSTFSKSITDSTENYLLALKLQRIFKGTIKFKSLKKGDKVGVIYIDKSWMGKKFGTQKVIGAFLEHKGKRTYRFLYKGRYYDEKATIRRKVSTFIVPCRYRRISDKFTRKRWHPILKRYRPHHGIDYANRRGTPIKATYDGIVTYRGRRGGYGKFIKIRHPNGYESVYGHLSRYKVRKGQRVKRGQVIGLMGSTGLSTGSHLHFGIKLNGRWINPANKIVIVKRTTKKLRKHILATIAPIKKSLKELK
jgi:murein DD-endopeptidase MepM/ murein hydrolase activator NlpD